MVVKVQRLTPLSRSLFLAGTLPMLRLYPQKVPWTLASIFAKACTTGEYASFLATSYLIRKPGTLTFSVVDPVVQKCRL